VVLDIWEQYSIDADYDGTYEGPPIINLVVTVSGPQGNLLQWTDTQGAGLPGPTDGAPPWSAPTDPICTDGFPHPGFNLHPGQLPPDVVRTAG
jgi:hypothetical protein